MDYAWRTETDPTSSPRPSAPMTQSTIAGLALLLLVSGCTGEVPTLGPPTLRGHEEVILEDDGSLLPLIVSDGGKIGLCLGVDPSRDTSRWKMTLTFDGRPSPSGPVAAAARSGATVCFDAKPPPELPEVTFDVCGALADEFDGSRYRVPCLPLRRLADDSAYHALMTVRNRLLQRAQAQELTTGELLVQLDGVAEMGAEHGFALFGVQVALIAVHFLTLEGTPAALAEAERRLAALPSWLDRPAARHQAALASYQRALFDLDARGAIDEAWSELAKADARFREIADPKRFTVTMAQASILHHVGAADEAIRRLREALEECEPRIREDDRVLLEAGKSNLAWLILLNPDASAEELREAKLYLGDGLSGDDRLEQANRLLDLAYLDVRLGREPGEHLVRARDVLAGLQLGEEHGRRLAAWADLVEGAAALELGRAPRALELCSRFTGHRDPFIAVWAAGCAARAYRLEGRAEEAWRAIASALVLAYDTSPHLVVDQRWTLGSSQRAEDFALAALISIERGDAGRAWDLLLDLDRLSVGEAERRRCRQMANAADLARWRELESEISSVLEAIRIGDVPAAPERREEQEQVLRASRTRLQELWHEWPGCDVHPRASDTGLRYRAFAAEGEVVLLRRDDGGRVEVAKRTPFSRRDLRELHDRILAAFERQDLDDAGWRELLGPVAAALLPPDPAADGTLVTYALHGLLQSVPLAALPLSAAREPRQGAPAAGSRWFGETAVVALQPAGTRTAGSAGASHLPPLFVVDPRSNLPASAQLLSIYRGLFPGARILAGEAATRDAFRRESARAGWLHVDAHGLYDPVYPQLSALQLADGPIHWIELADRPMSYLFAHLSGCQTGRWPITPDSGGYGIAGLVTRLGAAWAIASRSDLADRVAMDFNRVFYESIAAERPVPEAYRRAWTAVAKKYPAGAWGGLLLLRGASAGQGV